jgi:hypothetical protein
VKLISLVNSKRCKWHHLVISLELTNYYEIGLKVTSDMVGLMGGNLCEDSPFPIIVEDMEVLDGPTSINFLVIVNGELFSCWDVNR